jgi:hypothetical protein
MASIVEDLKHSNQGYFFTLLCLTWFLITFVTSNVLLNDELYFNQFGEQMTYEQIRLLLDFQYKYQWISYLMLPVIYLFKLLLLTIVLLTGTIFWNINVSFKKLFQIALIAEFLFIIPSLVKLFWFLFFETNFDLVDLQTFYPLSILNLIDIESIPQWSIYPVQLLNVFEVVYWCILAFGISLVAKERWPKMLGLVASSYGVGLFVWVVFIIFITINLS